MSNFNSKLARGLVRLAYRIGGQTPRSRYGLRTYQAAQAGRLTEDLPSSAASTSADHEIRKALRILRSRSRTLARSNDYAKRFFQLCENGIVGPAGIRLQCQAKDTAGNLDKELNKKVEDLFNEWSHKEFASADGKSSFKDLQDLTVRTLAKDGEVLIRKVATSDKFGFALYHYGAEWLDENYNHEGAGDDRRIVMSVEMNSFDRVTRYFLTPPYGLGERRDIRSRTPFPASSIIHIFRKDEPGQTRGVPWLHTAVYRLGMIGSYEEAEVVASRLAASAMGFIKRPAGDLGLADDEQVDLGIEAAPGTFPVLPEGYELQTWDPQHPHGNYPHFMKMALRGIAAGAGVSYNNLANDLEAVNYSSIRQGELGERDLWRSSQQFMIEHFCRDVYHSWLKSVVSTGTLKLKTGEYEKLLNPAWRARGWSWVDPLKDVQATGEAVALGLETLTDAIAEQGGDVEETFRKRQAELKLARSYGLNLTVPTPASAAKGGPGSEVPGAEKGAPGADDESEMIS